MGTVVRVNVKFLFRIFYTFMAVSGFADMAWLWH